MLKPIVNMNTMAMNESIATTCCYVWNGISYAGSASLPHGGKLVGKGNSYVYYHRDNRSVPVSKAWLNWKGGHVKVTADGALASSNAPYESGGKWYLEQWTDTKIPADITDPTYKNAVSLGWCDHTLPGCKYEKVSTGFNGMKHVGATSAHYTYTSGNSWLSDHTAYQYSS